MKPVILPENQAVSAVLVLQILMFQTSIFKNTSLPQGASVLSYMCKVCVCVCVCVCGVLACMCVCVCVYMYVNVNVCVQWFTDLLCMCVCMYVCECVCSQI